MKKYILFDLDGTLTDSLPGITRSVAYALKAKGIEVENLQTLQCFVGPPLKESFQKYYGFSEEEAGDCVKLYREYYTKTGIFENAVYDGIEPLLRRLKEKGAVLLVATSKPEVYAKQILEYFHLDSYFDFIGGAELTETRTAKAEVIRYVLEEMGISDRELAVMVGDREHDVLGAKVEGVSCIGVLYGYGSREELEKAGADWIARDQKELESLLFMQI